ncbi:MAG: hypothetical protein LBK42_13845 [Propionibacteriaceae bacterium]|nr:hypothetical protein [Propionibacteriaceae bacterium]
MAARTLAPDRDDEPVRLAVPRDAAERLSAALDRVGCFCGLPLYDDNEREVIVVRGKDLRELCALRRLLDDAIQGDRPLTDHVLILEWRDTPDGPELDGRSLECVEPIAYHDGCEVDPCPADKHWPEECGVCLCGDDEHNPDGIGPGEGCCCEGLCGDPILFHGMPHKWFDGDWWIDKPGCACAASCWVLEDIESDALALADEWPGQPKLPVNLKWDDEYWTLKCPWSEWIITDGRLETVFDDYWLAMSVAVRELGVDVAVTGRPGDPPPASPTVAVGRDGTVYTIGLRGDIEAQRRQAAGGDL